MQTHDYACVTLWDTAIKFSLQSRTMTSPDHLVKSPKEVTIVTGLESNPPLFFFQNGGNFARIRSGPIEFTGISQYYDEYHDVKK